jgi:hypothetical protein
VIFVSRWQLQLEVASAAEKALMINKDNPALTPSLSDKNRQVLRNQIIDDKGPGTILRDFENLLEFIGPDGVSVSGKNNLFSLKWLPQLNE